MCKMKFVCSLIILMSGLVPYAAKADGTGHGKEIYVENCLACHGSDGTGSMPGVSDLVKKGGGIFQDDTLVLQRMLNGYQSANSGIAMPPRGGNPALTESDLQDVLKYMRKEFQVSR